MILLACGLLYPLFCGSSTTLTKEDVIAAYKEKFRHLESWRAQYSSISTEVIEDQSIDTAFLVEFYGKGDSKRALIRSKLDVQTDSARPVEKRVYNGEILRQLFYIDPTNQGVVSTIAEDALLTWGSTSPLGYAGLYNARWDGSGREVSGSASCDMTVLMRVPYSRVVAEPVLLDGRRCYLVETGDPEEPVERRWLAPEQGLAVVRYEGYYTDPSVGRFLSLQVVFNDFVELAPSLFMPHAIDLDYFRLVKDKDGGNERVKKILTRRFSLTSLELNPEIADAEFELIFPPNTFVNDKIVGEVHVIRNHIRRSYE